MEDKASVGMKGRLGVRVVRVNPTLRQRVGDLVRRVFG